MKRIMLILVLFSMIALLPAALMWDNAVPIRQGVNIEWFRTGTETTDGGALYVWSDTKLGERDLWAQKVNADGTMAWAEPLLVDGKPDRQEDPVVCNTSDGNYIIAWIDFSDDPDGSVYAQKINNNGQLLWQQGGKPVCVVNDVQIALNMEPDMDGGAFILWSDSRNPSKDLYGQRISGSGNPLWTVNGIPIANGSPDEVQNTMLPDGQGGLIVAYTSTFVGEADIFAKHFNASGVMTWTEPLVLANTVGNQFGVRMATMNNSEYIFTWTDQRSNDPDIYAQKINIAGQKLWSEPFIVYSDQSAAVPVPQQNPRIQKTSDNCVVIVWEDFRLDNQNADLFGQKLSVAGTKLWDPAGIAIATAEFAQIGQRMDADDNGGVYIVWDDLRNGNSPNDDVYAQHITSTGTALWTAGGKAICTMPNEQNGGLVKVSGNNIFINWMDLRNGSVGIYYQVLNAAGTAQLPENGQMVFWGLSGDTTKDEFLTLSRSNDSVLFWQDTRFANEGYRIYYQILNPDGSIELETNGRPVTVNGGGKQEFAHAVVTDDDHFAVVWTDGRSGNPNVYMQLFSPSGERLWGDNGLKITVSEGLSQIDPKISYHNGSFYVGWSNWDQVGTNFRYHVYGQRLLNAQKQWGDNGILISTLLTTELNNECKLADLMDDMYVWHRVNPATGAQTIWTKRVGSDGNAYTGWVDAGLQASSLTGWTIQLLPAAHKTPDGVFVMWKDLRGDGIFNFWGQHISKEGNRLWDPLGVNLADREREQELPAITSTGTGVVFAWCENINGMHDIIAQKFTFPGVPQWGTLGNYIVQKDSTQSNPTLVSFDGNGMMIAWTDYLAIESDIYYDYINANGSVVLGGGGAILSNASKAQYNPKATALNDEAIVVWADGRSSGKTEILGLYAMKVNNQSVANSDASATPVPALQLKQNYPNPFNPETSIALNIPKAGKLNLSIYNAKGQLVTQLFAGDMAKGEHNFTWNGKDENGKAVASGIYFYTAITDDHKETRKMLLMK